MSIVVRLSRLLFKQSCLIIVFINERYFSPKIIKISSRCSSLFAILNRIKQYLLNNNNNNNNKSHLQIYSRRE
jgi:hypothetical protein